MRESATLKLTDGREVAVELDSDDLDQQQIVVHRADRPSDRQKRSFLDIIDAHLATAKSYPDGTTDRFLEEDRSRDY